MQINVDLTLGHKDFVLEIKRDPETSGEWSKARFDQRRRIYADNSFIDAVFTCIWSSCGAVFCDSDTAKRHVTHCSERPKGLEATNR